MSNSSRDIVFYPAISGTFRKEKVSDKERKVLDEVNNKVAAGLTLDEVMNFVFDSTSRIFDFDRVGLTFLEEENTRLTANWARADYEHLYLKNGYSEDLRGSSLEKVLRGGVPRVINDLEKYLDVHPESVSTKLVVKEGVRSSMTCPLKVEERIVGLYFMSSRKPNAYDTHQAALHMMIAERLSQSVEKARLIEQLRNAGNAYLEMLGFVSHELKNPLSSMITDIYMLKEGYLGNLTDEQMTSLERIDNKTEYIINMVREYLDLSRLEAGNLSVNVKKNVDLAAEVVEPAIDIVLPQIEANEMKLDRLLPAERVKADVDGDLLKIVVVNFVGNAAKYGLKGGRIEVSLDKQDEKIVFSVYNDGPGFSKEHKSKLFRKFSRLDEPELMQHKGTGVGLYTCRRIIKLHNGSIWADSEKGKWAKFSFEIPIVYEKKPDAE